MPYEIICFPRGLLTDAVSVDGKFRSESSAKNSKIYKVLKERGYSPRIVKTKGGGINEEATTRISQCT